jgi:AsmA protein
MEGNRHKTLRIAVIAAGIVVLTAVVITALAAYNLTALIARDQTRILYRVSRALDRPVHVGQIKARVGLGLAIEIDGLKIGDDPAFSREPFVSADQAALDVQFLPLLRGKIKVQQLDVTKPIIRVLRKADGQLNLSSVGGASPSGERIGRGEAALRGIVWTMAREVSIKGLAVEEGTVYYSDPTLKGVPLQINHLNVQMTGFHTGSPFDVDVKSAVFPYCNERTGSGSCGA